MIIIEGPNRVGKSTLVNEIAYLSGNEAMAVKPTFADVATEGATKHFQNLMASSVEASREFLPIWDRSWVSNFIYNQMLPERTEKSPIREALDAEIQFGLPMQFIGKGYIILRSGQLPQGNNDIYPFERKLDFEEECLWFKKYAERFPHWEVLITDGYTKADFSALAADLIARHTFEAVWNSANDHLAHLIRPPKVIGNPKAQILFVAPEVRNNEQPFMTPSGWELLRKIGDEVTRVAMTSQRAVNPTRLKHFSIAFAFGGKASTWSRFYARIPEVVSMPAIHNLAVADIEFIRKSIQTIQG